MFTENNDFSGCGDHESRHHRSGSFAIQERSGVASGGLDGAIEMGVLDVIL
jgi:hypothetical protein